MFRAECSGPRRRHASLVRTIQIQKTSFVTFTFLFLPVCLSDLPQVEICWEECIVTNCLQQNGPIRACIVALETQAMQ